MKIHHLIINCWSANVIYLKNLVEWGFEWGKNTEMRYLIRKEEEKWHKKWDVFTGPNRNSPKISQRHFNHFDGCWDLDQACLEIVFLSLFMSIKNDVQTDIVAHNLLTITHVSCFCFIVDTGPNGWGRVLFKWGHFLRLYCSFSSLF